MNHKTLKPTNKGARSNPKTLKQYEKLIGSMAYKAAVRASAMGIQMTKEDFAQELAISFLVSSRDWNENKNASFMNFFITRGWWVVNKFFVSAERRGQTFSNLSIDRDGSEDDSLHELINSGAGNPQQELEVEESIWAIRALLKGNSLAIFNILMDPPQLVVEQLMLKTIGAELDRECGGSSRSYPELDVRFLCTLFGLSKSECYKVKYDFDNLYKNMGSI